MNTENHYQETDLGNISLNPRGEYNPEESYEYLDLVVLEGGSYVCLAENGATITGISPESGKTTQYWQVITIPGSLTPEYIAMHDRVVNLSEQVGADAVEVRTAEQNVSGMELNVTQMQEQTRQSAEAAEQSKDSSAGYAASADSSRQAAEESEQNVNAQVTGFDSHVAEKTEEAENDIEAARIAANKAIIAQQEQSVNEVARAGIEAISTAQSAAQTATEKAQAADTSEKNAAASETAAKLSEANATKMAEQVATDKEQVANDRTAVENAKQEMTESSAQIEKNTQGIADLKGDLNIIADIKRNYFNQADAVTNTYYDGNVGGTIEAKSERNYYGIIFPVVEGKSYVVSKTGWKWFELDDSNTILAAHGNATHQTEFAIQPTAQGVKKVAVSWYDYGGTLLSSYMILDTGVSFSEHIPYPYKNTLTQSVINQTGIVTNTDIDVTKTDKVLDELSVLYNYFNSDDAVSGVYYDGNVGSAIKAISNLAYTGIIFNVEKGKTYVLERTDYHWFQLDEDNVILSREGNSNPALENTITPNADGVKKVAFSWSHTNVSVDAYMILDEGVSFADYIPYPNAVQISHKTLTMSGVESYKQYVVGANGDFTSFSDMLVALKDDTTPKIVYVQSGTYDIFSEMGGQTYIENLVVADGWKAANNIVPPNTKIIGVGNVILQYNPTDAQIIDNDHGWLMSPLNIVDSCEIENISVQASNCRYAIHIESASGGYDQNTAVIKLKNVRAHRAVTTLMGDHQTVGCGIGHNARWEFDNCRFTSNGTSNVFSVHTNSPSVDSGAVILMTDCAINTSADNTHTHKLLNFISQYLPVAITNIVNITNCYVGGTIGTETSITNRQSYDIDVIGGASYGLIDSSTQVSGYTINNCGNTILT